MPHGSPIQEVEQHCHLGVVFNKTLTWDSHINYICNKTNKTINILKRLKYCLSRKALERLYTSRIRPVIEYGDFIYDGCPKYLGNKLEHLQMEAARICTGAMRQTSSDKILNEVGWERLECRRKWHKLIMFYKISTKSVPSYLANICPPTIASTSRYVTRNSQSIRVPRCRTSHFKNSFLPSTIRHWNGLDANLRNSISLNIFKIKLKTLFRYKQPANYMYTGYRKASVNHTRLRLGMSPLAAHLFPYGSADTPLCSCGVRETTQHFLLECPHFAAQRTVLLVAIRDIIAPNLHWTVLPTIDKDRFMHIVLNGSNDLEDEDNVNLFKYVQCFIMSTGRFM